MSLIPLTPWSREQILVETAENHKAVHRTLVIDREFLEDLIDHKGDMQFIVRLAVIAEGATVALVEKKITDKLIVEWILKRTSHSDRLELLRSLGLIELESHKIFTKLAQIRNSFAHKPANLKRTLNDFYVEQEEKWKNDLVNSLAWTMTPPNYEHKKGDTYDDTCFRDNFRLALLTATMVPLYELATALEKHS